MQAELFKFPSTPLQNTMCTKETQITITTLWRQFHADPYSCRSFPCVIQFALTYQHSPIM